MTKLLTKALIANAFGLLFAMFMLVVWFIFVPFELSVLGVALYAVPCLLAYIVGVLMVLADIL